MTEQRILELKILIEKSSMFDPINHLESELFDLQNERVEINEPLSPVVLAEHITSEICEDCDCKLIFDPVTSDNYCEECGNVTYIGLHEDYNGWSDCHSFTVPYKYIRESHFVDHLLSIQGKETKTIPPELLMKIRNELIGIDKSTVTKSDMTKILKKIKKQTYYLNVNLLLHVTCNVELPEIPDDIFEKLIELFALIQKPFEMSKPKGRKNFLNYSYTIHKLLLIIAQQDPEALEFIKYFPLLKKAAKNVEHDLVFKKICEITNLPFLNECK